MEYWAIVLIWLTRMVIMAIICTFLGLLGVKILDALTPRIEERDKIGSDPVSTGIFIAGFIIFVGLVIHGACTAEIPIHTLLIPSLIDIKRVGLIIFTFFVSLFLGVGLFNLIDKLTPKIHFSNVNKSPIGIGIYVAGYLIFLGLVIHAALTIPI